MLQKKYPFDPYLKHHIFIALGLAIWIFCFLNFTEPLDINDLSNKEKWMYLPFYGIAGACTYLIILPLQKLLFNRNKKWTFGNEFLFIIGLAILGFILARLVYLYILVPDEPYPHGLAFFVFDLYIPALTPIMPIIIISRWALGKYKEKKINEKKIEIQGEGTYEGLKIHKNALICVKADDNYIEVCYLETGNIKKQLIRNKLSAIEKEHNQLLRTHRSYLIHPFHFKKWKKGQGKLALILTSELEVPVSKTYIDTVKSTLNDM